MFIKRRNHRGEREGVEKEEDNYNDNRSQPLLSLLACLNEEEYRSDQVSGRQVSNCGKEERVERRIC